MFVFCKKKKLLIHHVYFSFPTTYLNYRIMVIIY